MLDWLILFSLKRRWLVVVLAAVLLVWGYLSVRQMPQDVFPNFAPPQVVIQTEAPGLAPQEIEPLITLPLESALGGLPGVSDVRSSSAVGLSVITVIYDWSVNPYLARQLVTEKLQQVVSLLPTQAKTPQLTPQLSPIGDILKFALTIEPSTGGEKPTSLMELTTLANWQIRNRLLVIPGVARVLVIGGQEKQYQVLVKPDRLKQFGISLAEVAQAAGGANVNAPGGFLQTPDQEFLIRALGRVQSKEDLANSVITSRGGTPIYLKDVATIGIGTAIKRGDASFGGRSAIILTVSKQPGADTLSVTQSVEGAIADIKSTLPKDVRLTTTSRQADFIAKSIGNVVDALRDGTIIVVVILVLFLGNWRVIVITLTALPLSVLLGILALNALGVGLNTMTLGGLAIALGEVIDDAIIDAQNVYRCLRENTLATEPKPILTVIYEGSVQIRGSVVFATLILCVVIAPIFVLSGLEGRIFTPLGLAYIFSILASLIVALTVTPALCYLLLGNRELPTDESWIERQLKRLYRPVLNFAIANPWPILGGSTIAFLASLLLIPSLGTTFLPEFQERDVIVHLTQLPGASLSSTQQLGLALEASLAKYKTIETAQFRAGRAIGDTDSAGVNYGELDIQVAPDAPDRQLVIEQVRREVSALPGIQTEVKGFISERIDEVLSGTTSAVAIKLFGPNLATLRSLATEIKGTVQEIPGVADLQVEPQVLVRQLDIQLDRRAASRYGLTIADLAGTIETAFNGRVVSQVLEDQQVFDLVVWLEPAARERPKSIAGLMVSTLSGQKIPLSQVAKVSFSEGPNIIKRENVSRRIVISANASSGDVGSLVRKIREAIRAKVSIPQGYYLQYGGQYEAQTRSNQELVLSSLLALTVVVLLLYLAVRSVRSALLILSNLPLAFIGGLVAVRLGGGVVSVASLIGFITLFGIANRNGIILVTFYNQLLAEGKHFEEALSEACLERLTPVLMTALTAGLALVPLAFGSGEGKEILQPLAVVVLGGLFTSTTLTLVVIPALFSRFGPRIAPEDRDGKPVVVATLQ